MNPDKYYMELALAEAQLAYEEQEVPVGAVIVNQGRIIAKARNQTIRLQDPTAHAELVAISTASSYLQSRYLNGCSLYVTLEPCAMCAGACFWAQLGRIVYGATDPKRGYRCFHEGLIHPKTEIVGGVMDEACSGLLKSFFKDMRGHIR